MPDSEESNRRIDAELVDLRSRVAALEQERAALQQQIDALAGECYRFRTLIDHLPDYIFIKDTASRFVVNNRAHIELLGCATQEEVLGKTDFDIFPRELAEQYYADEQMLIRTGHPLIDREEKTISKTGKRQWLHHQGADAQSRRRDHWSGGHEPRHHGAQRGRGGVSPGFRRAGEVHLHGLL